MLRNSCLNNIAIVRQVRTIQTVRDNGRRLCARSFFDKSNFASQTRIYRGRKLIGFSMNEMYSVVADVRNYKNFLPFCKRSTILRERAGFLEANLVIGFPPLLENYTSKITLVEPRLVRAICLDGKLFNHLETTWSFSPALKHNPRACIVDFHLSFEFRSLLHSQIANLFFDRLVQQMEAAFVRETRRRYGSESLKSIQLEPIERS